MKVYHLKRTQVLPVKIEEAWKFFATPVNLPKITPAFMEFKIGYNSGEATKMYAGQIIEYLVRIAPGVRVRWLTEITQVSEPNYFVDEQRFGPYALWHHQHFFREVTGGVEMTDEVNYAVPFGIIGRLANRLFVERQLNGIFNYRFHALNQLFGKKQESEIQHLTWTSN